MPHRPPAAQPALPYVREARWPVCCRYASSRRYSIVAISVASAVCFSSRTQAARPRSRAALRQPAASGVAAACFHAAELSACAEFSAGQSMWLRRKDTRYRYFSDSQQQRLHFPPASRYAQHIRRSFSWYALESSRPARLPQRRRSWRTAFIRHCHAYSQSRHADFFAYRNAVIFSLFATASACHRRFLSKSVYARVLQ